MRKLGKFELEAVRLNMKMEKCFLLHNLKRFEVDSRTSCCENGERLSMLIESLRMMMSYAEALIDTD